MEESHYLKGEQTDDELLAFSTVIQKLKKRMEELGERYEKLNAVAEQTADY